jgi:hypothetical protein
VRTVDRNRWPCIAVGRERQMKEEGDRLMVEGIFLRPNELIQN